MSHRYGQEDKFKNITLKLEQVPQMHASTIVRASPADREHYRPSTPISNSKYIQDSNNYNHDQSNLNIEIRTTHLPSHARVRSITSSPNATSHLRHYEGQIIGEEELRRQLEEKEEIISELKNIIKLSNENNSRIKPKSVYLGDKSPDRHQEQKELKELRHNVKVLTIENNALSSYIDKLKHQLSQKNQSNREGGVFERQNHQLAQLDEVKEENQRLRQLLQEKENVYEKKIDEFIASHKSLANQCKRLQHMKEIAESENEKLSLMLRDLEETQRRSHIQEDKLGKTGERLSIVKIKEQYSESLRQVRETIHIQVENLFDNFRHALSQIDKRVSFLERRIHKAEEQIRRFSPDLSHNPTKKSAIYIEEGSQSMASERSARKGNFKSVAVSRLYEDGHRNNEDELVRPLHQEIGRLKEIITDLENQMSARSEYYTFREQQSSGSGNPERERELIHEVNRLKEEIDRLDSAYREEKTAMEEHLDEEVDAREEKISELQHILHEIRNKYEQSINEMTSMVTIKRTQQELTEQINGLRQENAQGARKLEQYKKLCQLLQEQSEENTINYELFSTMKQQICEIKEKSHYQQIKFNATEKQNKEILAANQQLKLKLEQSLNTVQKANEDYEQLKSLYRQSQKEKEELVHRTNYNEKVINILEGEINAKKEIQATLMSEKNALEKQLIGYLSLFNKLTFDQIKSSNRKIDLDELPIEDLLNKLSKLEASFNELHTSQRQKREIINKLMMSESMDEIELSSIKRKGRH